LKAPGLILMVGMLLILGGCSAAAVAALDNAMTSVNGDTCSVAKIFRGEAPCEDPEPEVVIEEEPLHCYRTLGVIDCYRAKDPFAKIEGRSPNEKLQVVSPGNSQPTGNKALLNSERLPADSRPTIIRRSTVLELKQSTTADPKHPVKPEEPVIRENTEQPFGPRKGKTSPLQS
jgi:hypothetical protein